MIATDANRPRNVDWKRAAALLYGDWGTSKAYVIGLAFTFARFSSFPIIIAVCVLTGLVGINYAVICRHFPDGGGVYSAAREQGRLLAVIGALLLVADLTVTAALSGWSALSYLTAGAENIVWIKFFKDHIVITTIAVLVFLGWVNSFGPKHSGSFAVALSLPTVIVVVALVALSIPHLTLAHLEPLHGNYGHVWVQFVNTILALSGVEAIANLTGVMKLDPGSTFDHPKVGRESAKAIFPVAIEVVFGTALLGWAMLSLPHVLAHNMHLTDHHEMVAALDKRSEDMLRFIAEQFGTFSVGPWFGQLFGWIVGIVFFLLLLSAANTAMVAMIGLLYMMARDGEMPRQFTRLNRHGVPFIPLCIAVGLPVIVLACASNFESLAGLYAIGVVGAITVNLGSCTFNKTHGFVWYDRALFATTFVILLAVEITLAKTKGDALFFVICVLVLGLGLRSYAQKRAGLSTVTVTKEIAELVSPEAIEKLRPHFVEGQRIMVSARGMTPVLRFALDEARLRKATLCVIFVKELAVLLPETGRGVGRARWQEDPQAAAIMSLMLKLGQEVGVDVLPVYAVSTHPASTILDLAATLGVDFLMLGASHRLSMARLLKGNVVDEVARGLPEDIQLIIHS